MGLLLLDYREKICTLLKRSTVDENDFFMIPRFWNTYIRYEIAHKSHIDKKKPLQVLCLKGDYFLGGGEENRTPVCTASHDPASTAYSVFYTLSYGTDIHKTEVWLGFRPGSRREPGLLYDLKHASAAVKRSAEGAARENLSQIKQQMPSGG